MTQLGDYLARSALWHVVGRFFWSIPLPVGLVLGVVAGGWYVLRSRSGRSTPVSERSGRARRRWR